MLTACSRNDAMLEFEVLDRLGNRSRWAEGLASVLEALAARGTSTQEKKAFPRIDSHLPYSPFLSSHLYTACAQTARWPRKRLSALCAQLPSKSCPHNPYKSAHLALPWRRDRPLLLLSELLSRDQCNRPEVSRPSTLQDTRNKCSREKIGHGRSS